MPRPFPSTWFVFDSIENGSRNRCVDLFERPDGTFGFEEFRRDAEDGGAWTATGGQWMRVFPSRDGALAAATATVGWLRDANRPGS